MASTPHHPHVAISGHGNAINLGGSNNVATVTTSAQADPEISTVLEALRALATEVGGPQGTALDEAANTLEGTPGNDKSAVQRVLTMAAAVAAGVSPTVVGAAEAVESVANALQAIGQ